MNDQTCCLLTIVNISLPGTTGINILSYCGFIEKAVKKGVDTLSAKAIAVEAPKVAAKVEAALNTAIGGQVRIPLKL